MGVVTDISGWSFTT